MFNLFLSILLISASIVPTRDQTNTIAIVGAIVVDGTGAEPVKVTVVVSGDRISAIGPQLEIPKGARVINAEGLTLVPGLFDLHTHLFNSSNGPVSPDWPKHLKAYLYCGVTSVVDLSPYPETYEPIRRLMSRGMVPGPRVSLAARITTPGGHGAEGGRGEIHTQEVSTPREAIAAVQKVVPYRPDVIKVFADGWRYGAASDMTSMNEDVLKAIVQEAHKNGIEVVTHTVTLEKAKIAARSGVDAIIHGIGDAQADEELIRLMKTQRTAYAPTLSVYERRERNYTSPILSAVLEPVAEEGIRAPAAAEVARPPANASSPSDSSQNPRAKRWEKLQQNTAMLQAAGVTFGAGTDAGMTGTHHGWATLHELELLVAGGLTPLQAITAATGNSARVLNVENERGTIAVGKIADLVLVEGAPHQRINDIERISRVFLGGIEIDRERLSRDILTPGMSKLPAIKAAEQLDDFESVDGRSRLDTLWLESTDSSHDHSRVIFGRSLRGAGNHALSAMARMSQQEHPFVRLNLPVSRGAIEPVDVSGFRGVRFDTRGDGEYKLVVQTREIRSASAHYQAPFKAEAGWSTVSIDFTSLRQGNMQVPRSWTGKDVLVLSFELARSPGEIAWLELDNLRFFK
jgi:imidazolonepropionase-like amidohydrolase